MDRQKWPKETEMGRKKRTEIAKKDRDTREYIKECLQYQDT